MRRVERALPGEYREAVSAALDSLDADRYDDIVALCELPDIVRGYEHIKLDNVERYRELLAAQAPAPSA